MGDFNLALLIVAIIVVVLVFIFNVYLLVNYQHPDDVNQVFFPKFVVVLGLSVAVISILMFPADVANRQACLHSIYDGACQLTLPMKSLWLTVYIVDAILVFFVIPFAMFFYEGDQDKSVAKRARSAVLWVGATAIVCGLVLGILYGLLIFFVIMCNQIDLNVALQLQTLMKSYSGKRVKKGGFTKHSRADYLKYKSENRIVLDGVNAKGCV